MRNERENIIFNSLKEVEQEVKVESKAPEGYIEINLSTLGKVGAPKSFHIRNFKVKDIMALALTEGNDTVSRVIQILNDMIYEDVDVSTWHEKEIEETLLMMYAIYYSPRFSDVKFPYNDEDIKYINDHDDEEHSRLKSLLSGKWVPKTDVDIFKSIETYDLEDNFTTDITITNKKTGFHVTFGFIKYGDQLTIRKWIDKLYYEKDMKFKTLEARLEENEKRKKKADNGLEEYTPIEINPDEMEEYNKYKIERIQTLSEVIRIISITNYNGQDVSNMSISDKYNLMAKDPRIDFGMISKLSNRQEKLKFGIKENIKMYNPIRECVESKPFTFQLNTILQAVQLSGFDDYDDGYDD